MKRISELWSKFAESFLGNKEGVHCHWCQYISHRKGYSYCTHNKSQYNDGNRIKASDGLSCANYCIYFKLDEYYTKDENFFKTFPKAKKFWG